MTKLTPIFVGLTCFAFAAVPTLACSGSVPKLNLHRSLYDSARAVESRVGRPPPPTYVRTIDEYRWGTPEAEWVSIDLDGWRLGQPESLVLPEWSKPLARLTNFDTMPFGRIALADLRNYRLCG